MGVYIHEAEYLFHEPYQPLTLWRAKQTGVLVISLVMDSLVELSCPQTLRGADACIQKLQQKMELQQPRHNPACVR